MSKSNQNENADDIFSAVSDVTSQLSVIKTFIARRFDEISMEINATSQQMDMAENGITKRFTEILEVISAISHKGDHKTAANAGVELDAIVDITEDAANKILDAAGRINACVRTTENWDTEASRNKTLEIIGQEIEIIFLACSFQDLTGQRIQKTLENLNMVEERLEKTLKKLGIPVDPHHEEILQREKANSQKDIDHLFGEKE